MFDNPSEYAICLPLAILFIWAPVLIFAWALREMGDATFKSDKHETNQCAKCKREQTRGNYFGCYYGNHLETRKVAFKTWKTSYAIAGLMRLWICRTCLYKGFILRWEGLGLLSLTLSTIGLILDADSCVSIWIISLLLVVVIAATRGWNLIGAIGDNQVIRIGRGELEAAGYDVFLTREEHMKLEK
jgi:hypothetical protein